MSDIIQTLQNQINDLQQQLFLAQQAKNQLNTEFKQLDHHHKELKVTFEKSVVRNWRIITSNSILKKRNKQLSRYNESYETNTSSLSIENERFRSNLLKSHYMKLNYKKCIKIICTSAIIRKYREAKALERALDLSRNLQNQVAKFVLRQQGRTPSTTNTSSAETPKPEKPEKPKLFSRSNHSRILGLENDISVLSFELNHWIQMTQDTCDVLTEENSRLKNDLREMKSQKIKTDLEFSNGLKEETSRAKRLASDNSNLKKQNGDLLEILEQMSVQIENINYEQQVSQKVKLWRSLNQLKDQASNDIHTLYLSLSLSLSVYIYVYMFGIVC